VGPERRCIATGESGPTGPLVRFVLGPGDAVVPDLAARLPGRGIWLTARADLVERAVKKKLFARAFRAPVKVPEDLGALLEDLLARRLIDVIGLARRAGQAVTGFEKVRARLKDGSAGVLLTASDAAADGREKLGRLAGAGDGGVRIVDLLSSTELGLAFGRDFAIHAALDRGGFADRAIGDAERLAGMRAYRPNSETVTGAARPAGKDGMEGPRRAPGQGD